MPTHWVVRIVSIVILSEDNIVVILELAGCRHIDLRTLISVDTVLGITVQLCVIMFLITRKVYHLIPLSVFSRRESILQTACILRPNIKKEYVINALYSVKRVLRSYSFVSVLSTLSSARYLLILQ